MVSLDKANLFITSFVPIMLIDDESGDIVWQSPVPASL